MQNKELQNLTASEPLTLEKEYAMQQSWMKDDNSKIKKYYLTGIIAH